MPKKPAAVSVFDRTVLINFQAVDPTFRMNLRRVVRYQLENHRLPDRTYRSPDGVAAGEWLAQCQRNPHILTENERAMLLCIPGMKLSPARRLTELPLGHASESEKKLWTRVSAWAVDEQFDAGSRKARHQAMLLRTGHR